MTDIGALTAKMVLADAADMHPPIYPPPGLIALRGVAYRERECARRGCLARCLRTDKMRTALHDSMITSPPRRSRLLMGYRGSLTCLIFAGSPKKRHEQEAQRSAKGDSKANERQTFHRHALWSRAARCFGGDDQTLKNGGLVSSAKSSTEPIHADISE
jgi:hypothetical protein